MKRTIDGIVKDGQVHPLEPLELPDDTPVKIVVDEPASPRQAARTDPMSNIYELAQDLGPEDLASNLERYLYGKGER
jgi:hypothetical protein